MTITVTSTSKIVNLSGIDCRIWEGVTSGGVKVHCFIPRVAAGEGEDLSQFEAELKEQAPPSAAVQFYPMRLIL